MFHKYGVSHKVSTPYHPKTNGQTKVFNKEVKKLLFKLVQSERKDWSNFLGDALWAQRIAYRTPLGMSQFRIVLGNSCHLHVEIEHKTLSVVKKCNLDLDIIGRNRKLLLQELEEVKLKDYDNSRIY